MEIIDIFSKDNISDDIRNIICDLDNCMMDYNDIHHRKENIEKFFDYFNNKFEKYKNTFINLLFISTGHCKAEIILIDALRKSGYKIGTVFFMDPIYSGEYFIDRNHNITLIGKIKTALDKCIQKEIMKHYVLFDSYGSILRHMSTHNICGGSISSITRTRLFSIYNKINDNQQINAQLIEVLKKEKLSDEFSLHAVISFGFSYVGLPKDNIRENNGTRSYVSVMAQLFYDKHVEYDVLSNYIFKDNENDNRLVFPECLVEFQSKSDVKFINFDDDFWKNKRNGNY